MKTYDEMFRGDFSPRPEVYSFTYNLEPEHVLCTPVPEAEPKVESEETKEVQAVDTERNLEPVPSYEIKRGLFGGTSLRRVE